MIKSTMYWKIRNSNANPKSKIHLKSSFIDVIPVKPFGMTVAQQQPPFYALLFQQTC